MTWLPLASDNERNRSVFRRRGTEQVQNLRVIIFSLIRRQNPPRICSPRTTKDDRAVLTPPSWSNFDNPRTSAGKAQDRIASTTAIRHLRAMPFPSRGRFFGSTRCQYQSSIGIHVAPIYYMELLAAGANIEARGLSNWTGHECGVEWPYGYSEGVIAGWCEH